MLTLRPYQEEIIKKGINILVPFKFLYLAMEVRTGKTITSLRMFTELWKKLREDPNRKKVLFITKKKAISSIEHDYDNSGCIYNIMITNYESLHKVPVKGWDGVVCDEAHCMGAFPKPSNRAKLVKEIILKSKPYTILLSGTPTPESYSQMYHQVYGIKKNPFVVHKNFYSFSKRYVNVKQKKLGGMVINDYSLGSELILHHMKPFLISYTQKLAGFESIIDEEILTIPLDPKTLILIKRLKKYLVIEGNKEVILADTAVKLMTKIHQLSSGTIKFESGNSMVVDHTKAFFILDKFKNRKIAIFYKFVQELQALKDVYKDKITTTLEEFDTTDKCIALQIVSGREGISLKNAECLVYYNIDFSATSYWQSRDRMTTQKRKFNKIYWVFSDEGIERKIYKAVVRKKDYTLSHFKKDLLTLN
tara:strand:- start:8499 stop:9758 length:1260 start_codon:yes stop_codon:yes gene_type:complete